MKKLILSTAMAGALIAAPAFADTVKVGFMTTLSGSAGVIGKQQENAVKLAMEHLGASWAGCRAR